MAIITLASASGAPGTTTAAIALSIAWHRPVLLMEADPAGVSAIAAGWFKGNPPHNRGLVNLAVAHRHGDLATALRENTFGLDQFPVTVLPGVRSPAQATSVHALWVPLVPILQDLDHNGMDVIIDAGRLIGCASPWPLVRASDAVLLTSRTNVPALAAARVWGAQLAGEFETLGIGDHLALLLVGEGRPFTAKEMKKHTGLSTVASLAWDPVNAQRISDGDARRLENPDVQTDPLAKGSYGRSVRAAASAVRTMVTTNRDVVASSQSLQGGSPMTDVTNDLKLSMWDDEDPLEPAPARAAPSLTSPSVLLRGAPCAADANTTRPASVSPTSVSGIPEPAPARVNGSGSPAPVAPPPATANAAANAVDWELVAAFRARASTNLTQAIQSRESLTVQAQRELGRAIILELLDAAAQEAISDGSAVFDPAQQQRMAQAIFDALFGLGRLQPLVDDERVENIEVYGCDDVLLEHADGSLHTGPPVAESDQELIEFLGFVATRSEGNARPFSEARPRLHMRLDNGSRLAASAWVTPRPAVVIRRHRLIEVDLEDLVARGTMTPVMASFMRAGVRARKSFVISGPQGGGKTTTLRALCAVLHPYERIGTFETEYELHLHELRDKHRRVLPFEARPGSGERGLDGRPAGEITIDELLYDSFRMNLSRQIVGEVRGPEVIAMFKAMQSGSGSLSTTHAGSAADAIDKLITCALEAGPHITEAYAQRAVARHIDLIVHMDLVDVEDADGVSNRRRYVSEIIAIDRGEDGAPSVTDVFRRTGRGPGAPHVVPDDLAQELIPFGFDIDGFNAQIGGQP